MATFDPNIYKTGMVLDQRREQSNLDAFQNIMGMMARQEMLNEERLNQQRKEAAAQAMQPVNIYQKAQMYGVESLSPQERSVYEFERAQSKTGYQDAAGNFVVTRQMPALGGGFGAVQAMQGGAPEQMMQQPAPQQVQQPMAAQAPSMDVPTFGGVSPQQAQAEEDVFGGVSKRVKDSPVIQKKKEEARIEFESNKLLENFKAGKADELTQRQKESAQRVLDRMREINNELKRLGGIASESQGIIERGRTLLSGTELGQSLSAVGNPKVQALRDEYKKQQSTFLPFYATAANLGAKSLDSEGERQSILDSFGNPVGIYEANDRQLNNLTDLIGTGGRDSAPEEKPATMYREGQTATNKETGEKLIFKGGRWQKM